MPAKRLSMHTTVEVLGLRHEGQLRYRALARAVAKKVILMLQTPSSERLASIHRHQPGLRYCDVTNSTITL